ncbi:MAG: 2-amino-4-hydroxy-6-hydroxymethyldihydropteridine diphosphokinase [Pelagibacteraceae bacterium]
MIFLNIGSNLNSKYGNRSDNILRSIELLVSKEIKIIKKSGFYETPSYPDKSYPKFLNISLCVLYQKTAKELLYNISLIEKQMGRKKIKRNDPRIIDIDIIDFNKEIINHDNLTLPHRSLKDRNFVLIPLKEICPDWSHPISNEKIDILIEKLESSSRNEITRINQSDINNL